MYSLYTTSTTRCGENDRSHFVNRCSYPMNDRSHLDQQGVLPYVAILCMVAVTRWIPFPLCWILMKDTNALETPSGPVMGYCVKCRAKRELEDLEEVETKQKLGVRGKCVECGCKIMRFTGSKTRNRPKGYRVEMARLRRAEARRQKLIDSVPAVRVAYGSDQDDPDFDGYDN